MTKTPPQRFIMGGMPDEDYHGAPDTQVAPSPPLLWKHPAPDAAAPTAPSESRTITIGPGSPVAPDSLVARLREGSVVAGSPVSRGLFEKAADRIEQATNLLRRHEGHDPAIRAFLDAARKE